MDSERIADYITRCSNQPWGFGPGLENFGELVLSEAEFTILTEIFQKIELGTFSSDDVTSEMRLIYKKVSSLKVDGSWDALFKASYRPSTSRRVLQSNNNLENFRDKYNNENDLAAALNQQFDKLELNELHIVLTIAIDTKLVELARDAVLEIVKRLKVLYALMTHSMFDEWIEYVLRLLEQLKPWNVERVPRAPPPLEHRPQLQPNAPSFLA